MRVVIVVLAALALLFGASAKASSLYFTLDTGLTAFKYGVNQSGLGFPHFEDPKWDIEPGLEWSPSFLERRGLWLRLSFPWQALGDDAQVPSKGQTYIDGPRLGIKLRGKLVQ